MSRRPLFDRPIAHRGLHDRAGGIIENSASAFAAAISAGYAIECDLQLSADGVPIVFHDDTLERLTGRPGPVGDLTADELTRLPLLGSSTGDCPQRFTDFLAQIGGRTMLQVELKRQTGPATGMLAKKAAEAVANYTGPLTFESFDPALIIMVKSFGFAGKRGIITYGYDKPDWDKGLSGAQRTFLRHLLHWPMSRFDFISCHTEALDLPAIRFWRSLGTPVTAWTVRSPTIAQEVRDRVQQIVFEGFSA